MHTKIISTFIVASFGLTGQVSANSVTVFSTTRISLTNLPHQASVIHLDRSQLIEEQMSAGLPSDPQTAALQLHQRMQTPAWLRLEHELQQSAAGLAKAQRLGIEKLPAVVIDDRVVYGLADVARAVELIQGGNVQ